MIRTHKIVKVQTHDFHGKGTMAHHPGKFAQNHAEAPLRREGIESDCGPNGHEKYKGRNTEVPQATGGRRRRWVRGRCKLDRARSRLHRGQNLQVNVSLKALAEIYTMHSFAQLCNLIFFSKFCQTICKIRQTVT